MPWPGDGASVVELAVDAGMAEPVTQDVRVKCSEFLLSKFRAMIPNKDAQQLAQMVRSVEEKAFNKFSNNKVS